MKIQYFKIIFLLIFIQSNLSAQTVSGVAGAYGNFIFAGRDLPIGENEKIILKNGEPIAKLSFPQSEDEMIARVKDFYSKNPYYSNTPDSLLINYWQWATGFYFIDSLPMAAKYPDVLVGLGVIYFEEIPETDNSTNEYKIKNSKLNESVRVSRPYTNTQYPVKFLKQEFNQNQIILDWMFKGSFDILKIKTFKEYVGQNQMTETDLITFLIKSNDTVIIRVMDTSTYKGLAYKYHIQLIDPIGRVNKNADTAFFTFVPQNTLPVIFNAKTISNDDNKSIDLSWKLQNKNAVQSIDIFRSEKADSGYTYLSTVGANDSFYRDLAIKPVTGYWYKIVINGVFERGLTTTFIAGILKKGGEIIPVNQIQTETVSKGVIINWIKNADDTRGFYIYRANGYKGEFEQIGSLILAENNQDVYSFTDSSMLVQNGGTFTYMIKTLSKGYVMSADGATSSIQLAGKNEQIFINDFRFQQEGKSVLLIWKSLVQISSKIVGYNLYKKEGLSDWKLLEELSEESNQFIDTTLDYGKTYQFKVVPVMVGNQEGSGSEIEVKLIAPYIFAPEISSILQVGKSVFIQIEKNEQSDVEEILIYRVEEGKTPQKVGTLKSSETEFEDKTVEPKKSYLYYIIVKTKYSESEPSTPNKIEIN